jgi:glycosyltransferase involved in cell wall biosynthesis
MKIGVFTESFLPQVNGVVTAVCASAKVLSKRHTVDIFTVGDGPGEAVGCKVHRFRGMKLPTYKDYRFFMPSRSVWKRMVKHRLDVVHVRSSVGFGLVALRFARKRGIPIVGTLDTPISDYVHYVPVLGRIRPIKGMLSSTALKYMVWFYNRCDAVIVPSNATGEWLKGIGCKSRITVMSNGVDTGRFNPNKRSSSLRKKLCKSDGIIMLHVGRITKEKSVEVIIKAANRMKEAGTKFVLVIAGRGPELAPLKRMTSRLGLGDHVRFVGFVPDGELAKYYASADVFVTASPVETEGIVMLEAMASGLPVVGANAGAIPEIVENGVNGHVFKPGSHLEMAKAISKSLEGGAHKRLARNALTSSKRYSIEKTAKQLEMIYSGLLISD